MSNGDESAGHDAFEGGFDIGGPVVGGGSTDGDQTSDDGQDDFDPDEFEPEPFPSHGAGGAAGTGGERGGGGSDPTTGVRGAPRGGGGGDGGGTGGEQMQTEAEEQPTGPLTGSHDPRFRGDVFRSPAQQELFIGQFETQIRHQFDDPGIEFRARDFEFERTDRGGVRGAVAGSGIVANEALRRDVEQDIERQFEERLGVDVTRDDFRVVATETGGVQGVLTEEFVQERQAAQRQRLRAQLERDLEEETGRELDQEDIVYREEDGQLIAEVAEEDVSVGTRTVVEDGESFAAGMAPPTDPPDVSFAAGTAPPGTRDIEPVRIVSSGFDRELYPEGTDVETIGAAGPLGVTVPTDRDAGATARAAGEAISRGIDELVLLERFEPAGGETVVPEGAPGAPVMVDPGQDVAQDISDIRSRVDQAILLERVEPAGMDATVPEGAPGAGVVVNPGSDTVEDFREIRRAIEASLEPTEPMEVRTFDEDEEVVGAAGPLGVTAPEDQAGVDEVEAAVQAVRQEFVEYQEPTGGDGVAEVPAGAPGAGNLVTEQYRPPGDIETVRAEFGEAVTGVGAVVTDPVERELQTQQEEVVVSEEVGEVIITKEEAEELPEETDEFGDFDPVLFGIDIERTAVEGSRRFRGATAGFAEETTDFVGFEEGSFADVATETGLRTFPEIFNVPGLTKDAIEIAEAGAFVAADPDEHASEIAIEAQREIDRTVEFFRENPAAGVGTGAALAIQLPTSLATLRGLRAVDPRLARFQDVLWNTPERVTRRIAGIENRPLFAEFGELPGFEQRTAAFGGGQGPGQISELRFRGRTIARTEVEPEIDIDETFSVSPEFAEIETRPEYRFGPELETAIETEAEVDRLAESQQPEVEQVGPVMVQGEQTIPREVSQPEINRLPAELELILEQELELRPEVELERELEQELEMELEQELEQELELELEQELEPELRERLPPVEERNRRERYDPGSFTRATIFEVTATPGEDIDEALSGIDKELESI